MVSLNEAASFLTPSNLVQAKMTAFSEELLEEPCRSWGNESAFSLLRRSWSIHEARNRDISRGKEDPFHPRPIWFADDYVREACRRWVMKSIHPDALDFVVKCYRNIVNEKT